MVMGWSWTWEAVDPHDCARIVGDLPGPDSIQEWRLLTHAPYTRVGPQPYTIGGLAGTGPGKGLAGQLRHGAERVATVVEIGALTEAAPAAQLTATTAGFDAEGWQAFVAAARRCGEPMTEAAVLDALAEETLLATQTAEAVAAGGTLARLLDDTGTILHLERIHPAPDTPETFHALQDRLHASRRDPRGTTWQYWTGRSWRHLTNAADTDQPPTGGGTATT
ncbi:hypothetical protein OHA72_10440 [Dactylosporangium sp. NBC_01737]|uniref:hypothetical protein n=1 Tax=Dactylosporangium sp. NBC_01737 TaxID=2975959 RepID=UPI002E149875|nr:hypothetical protein OHA72_10440 [Dactylosporangium sp. NBC_01737]